MSDGVQRTICIDGLDSLVALSWSDRPGGRFSLQLEVDDVHRYTTLRAWEGSLGKQGPARLAAAIRECQSQAAELIGEHTGDDTPEPITPGAARAFEAVLAELEGAVMLTLPEKAFALVWPDGSKLLAVPRTDRLSRLRQRWRGPVVADPGTDGYRTKFPGSRESPASREAFMLPSDYRYEVRAAPHPWSHRIVERSVDY